jgi:hypothetical protein
MALVLLFFKSISYPRFGLFTIFFVIVVFGVAVGSLLQANSLQHADDFISKLQEAERNRNA